MPASDPRTILITGANAGIGRAAAEQFARRGHRVVMACRTHERGAPAHRAVLEATGNPDVELLTADLGVQEQVRGLAAQFRARHDRLDVLVNNAGLYKSRYTETPDGIETTWAVNHLAPFLLTALLRDRLRAAEGARVVTVSSNAHYRSDGIRFDDPGRRADYSWVAAYAQSKLANILFTRELARRLDGTGVTATTLHPGVVATRIWNRNANPISLFMRPLKLLMTRPSTAAKAVVHLALDADAEAVNGRYHDGTTSRAPSRAARDDEAARRLWTLSEAMTGLSS